MKPAGSSGWLSRLWKRSDSSSPGPVKANLGEQSSFYFDKELGKWVNKSVSGIYFFTSPSAHRIGSAGGCAGIKTCCPTPTSARTDCVAKQVNGWRTSAGFAAGRRATTHPPRHGWRD